MNHREYIAARQADDAAFREARAALRPNYEFRRALIGARLGAGMTQKELAALLGTTQSAVARLEAGQSMPTVETFCKLADVLGVRFEIAAEGLTVHSAPSR